MYGDSNVGDLFCEVNGRHCYIEVVEYKGKLGFRGLMSGGKIRTTPLWAMPPESLKYLGNGAELRARLKALMEVDTYLHYGQQRKIIDAPEYEQALREWSNHPQT